MATGQEIDQLFWTLNANTVPLVGSVAGAQKKLGGFSAFMKTPIGALTALGAAAALVGIKATKMAAQLDAGIREVSTLLPGTVEDMSGLRDQVIALSTRVPDPPPLLTKGLYQIISAGITDTADAMFVLETASRAAVAGISDTFTAADALTTVLNAFQLEASEATHVADVFFATIREGKTTFPELAANIGNVATSAAQAGLSMEEMGAAIATMTKFGIDTAEATTALNRLIFSLIQNTPEAARAAEALGLEFSFARLEAIGFTALLKEVKEATDGNIKSMAKINPSIRALRSLLILAGDGFGEYERITTVATASTGAMREASDKMQGSLQNQWALLKNKLNVAWLHFGNRLLPDVIALVKLFNRVLGESNDEMADFRTGLAGYSEAGVRVLQLANRRERDELLAENERLKTERAAEIARPFTQTGKVASFDAQMRENRERIVELLTQSTTLRERENELINKSAFDRAGAADVEEEIVQFTEDQLALQEKLGAARAGVLAGLTTTAVDDMMVQFDGLVDDITAAFGSIPTAWQEVLDAMTANIESVGLAETMNAELDVMVQGFEQRVGVDAVGAVALFTQGLQNWVDEARRLAAAADEGSLAQKRYNDLADKGAAVIKKMVDNSAKLRAVYKGAKIETADLTDETKDLVRELSLAGRGVLDLAQAFGVLDRDAASALNSAINIGAAIADIAEGGLTGGAAGAIFAGAANIFSVLTSGGATATETPAARARREAMERNTEAIRELTSSLRTQEQVIFGGQFQAPLATIGEALAAFDAEIERRERDDPEGRGLPSGEAARIWASIMADFGLDLDDLKNAAAELGLEWSDVINNIDLLGQAIAAIDWEELTQNVRTQLGLLQRRFDLFDISDPMDQIAEIFGVLAEFTDLELPDLTDPAAIDAWVRNMFEAVAAGGKGLTGTLGGLSLEAFLDLLGNIEGTLDGMEDGVADGVTQSFAVSRTITEVTGNRIAGLLTTDVHWNELTAARALGILDVLTAMSLAAEGGALEPPEGEVGGLPGSGSLPAPIASPIWLSADITVQDSGDPSVTARAVREELEGLVNSRLGAGLTDQRRAIGLRPVQGLPR